MNEKLIDPDMIEHNEPDIFDYVLMGVGFAGVLAILFVLMIIL